MKRTRNILMTEMLASIIISLAIVTFYETEILSPGTLECDTNTEFLTVSIMEIMTICMIPLALRLFKFKKISTILQNTQEYGLLRLGSLRMAMLCIPLIANTLLYYIFGFNVAFGYMGIICLVCLIFIYPSMSRCETETNKK